jgi:hypothetical protein
MLPRCRTADEPFVIPPFDVQVSDVEGFMDELQEFPDSPGFSGKISSH